MILSFSTRLNDKPTYFVEKIHSGLVQNNFMRAFNLGWAHENFDTGVLAECQPKIHTIREDKNNRWKKGVMIDFFINCRQKDMFKFAPRLPVVSVQNVEIRWVGFRCGDRPWVQVDGKLIYALDQTERGKMLELAQNDGFDSIEAFFEYFNEDFKGKLIHWTDLRY